MESDDSCRGYTVYISSRQVRPCSTGTNSSVFKLISLIFVFIALVQQGSRCWKDRNVFCARQSYWNNLHLSFHSIPLPIPSYSRYILQSNIHLNNPVASLVSQRGRVYAPKQVEDGTNSDALLSRQDTQNLIDFIVKAMHNHTTKLAGNNLWPFP